MPAIHNQFKARLLAKEVQIGCWASMADAYVAEMLGTTGFDWVVIDGEHAPNDIRSIMSQLQALKCSPSSAVVRLPYGDPVMIKQALDIGANSLLIPMVESAEQAEALVKATRYLPYGMRGVGAGGARVSEFGAIPDYLTTADEQICLLLQVENLKGIAALDDILKVKGVDGVFIGPSDLSADMGYLGQTENPIVRAEVVGALKRIRAAGVAAGVLTLDENFAQECVDMGVEFVAVAVDAISYVRSLRALSSKFKR